MLPPTPSHDPGDRSPAAGAGARPRHRFPGTLLAFLVVTLLAVADLSVGPTIVLAGLLTAGPCLAAVTGSPRTVGATGAYTVLVLLLLSWPDGLWWTEQQLFLLLGILAVTAISAAAAWRRERDERRRHEAEAESVRAQASSEATGLFLSRVSHELRTPLNAVVGFTQLLQRGDLTPDQRETTDLIARAGEHLRALVDDVLDVTALESGMLTLSLEPVALHEVVGEALELTEPQAAARDITLRSPTDLQGWHVRADLRRLRQVLLNLLSNAVKFNEPGGTVTITASRAAGGTISVAVTDTGPGIPPEDLHRLFRPFERLGAALEGIEGTGLGLALSRGLAETMGGTLTATSAPGTGATFTVTLLEAEAVDTPRVAVPSSPAPEARVDSGPARVLYVEDNPSNLRLVEQILQLRPSWTLVHAANGAEGLDLATAEPFDLVLLDQDLPDVNGLEVLRRLRVLPDRAATPVTVVSADAAPGQQSRALDAGATGYLVKPFQVDALLRILDGAAPRRAPEQE